ncbi:MAG: GHKL domain-containing protein [Bacteroidetes bacterium]|nr:GHKL domain-containing protein [Bacteroidota bacterium]
MKKLIYYFIALFAGLICMGFINLFYGFIDWYFFLAVVVFLVSVGLYLKRDLQRFTMQAIIFYIALFSIISTYCFSKYNTYKEKEKRKILAWQMSIEKDPIAEYMFEDVKQKIISDTIIENNISSENSDETFISERIQQNYLNGYWSRYNIQITLCKPDQMRIIKPENIIIGCDSFFTGMISNIGLSTINPDMFFLNNGTGRNSYIAKVPFYKTKTDSVAYANLYIELYSRLFSKDLGYPELLIDKDIKINRDIYNYSYVKYYNNELVLQYGKYYYSMNADSYKLPKSEYSFFEKAGFSHLYYSINNNTSLIISKKSETLLDVIAPFSYIFLLYCLFVLMFQYVLHFPIKRKEINFNFKARVQLYMVSILVISFVVIGASGFYYIINLYNKKNVDNVSEKAHSVLIEIESKLSNMEHITIDSKDNIAELLTKFSNIFFTDINLYTPDGLLIASSRPQVFEEGMISKRMNTEAFNEISLNKKTLYIHNENIGKLKYLSVYVPLRNNNNFLLGYLNLPYFAKQSELHKEISTFFIAFININVMLTALAIIIALLVANHITKPLKLIREKLSQIKLGKKNEKIEWTHHDEIGSLIGEYNRMVDEIANSAELLAKSERESAWREMAKQVAHEIKNPLTPMKLSIQYLQKSWDEKTPDWDKRLKSFTLTMIEQIEALSKIASEFSDFAKTPKANNENIDLIGLLESSVAIFQDNKKFINITKPESGECIVFADRTQILRVFNNLLKNSVQATDAIENMRIDIVLSKENAKYLIKFSDNGVGISDEQKEKIFSPNFTTKTGGTGLGLAMVKSIVESYNGKIWFESEAGKGSTFMLELPAVDFTAKRILHD